MSKRIYFALQWIVFCWMVFLSKPLTAGEGYVNNNGVEIFYREFGKKHAQPLVLVHGFPLSGEMFDCVVDDLKLYFRIVTIDQRGFGRSSKNAPSTAYTYIDFASDLDAVVNHLGIKYFALGGMSYGSVTVEQYTVLHPEKVSHLILISPFYGQIGNVPPFTLGLPVPLLMGLGNALLADTAAADAAFINNGLTETCKQANKIRQKDNQIASQSPANAQANLINAQFDPLNINGLPSLLPTIQQPTLIFYGNQDILSPRAAIGQLLQDIPNSTLVEVVGGHLIAQTESKQLSQAIFNFIFTNPAACQTCY